MPLLNKEKFLEDVILQVKFKHDRNDIRKELEAHILDKIEYYIEQGYDKDKAEELSVSEMGDAKEIGKELNKQHNPLLGWIWRITNLLLVIFILINIFTTGIYLFSSLFIRNPIRDIDTSNIAYKIDVNEKVKIDDTVIHFTDVIYHKSGDLSIVYKHYNTRYWGAGWSLGAIGEISDNLGNTYFSGGGQSSSGIITRGIWKVSDFSKEADTLIITYDYYNRYFKIEIPLKTGEDYE